MPIKVQYKKYVFKVPPPPEETIFEAWKKVLPIIPDLDIEPKIKSFLQLNPRLKILAVIIGGILLTLVLIYILFVEILSIVKPGGIFDLIYILILLVFIVGIMGLVFSVWFTYGSYSEYKWESKKHYTKLKKIVKKSNNYNDFLLNYKAYFGNDKELSTYDKLNQKIDKLFGVN